MVEKYLNVSYFSDMSIEQHTTLTNLKNQLFCLGNPFYATNDFLEKHTWLKFNTKLTNDLFLDFLFFEFFFVTFL